MTENKQDDGVYEIEFQTAKGGYEFEIAGNGEIVEQQIKPAKSAHVASTGKSKSSHAGQAKAEQVALNAAKISRQNIKYINSFELYKSGKAYAYQVQFGTYNNTQYRYVIDINNFKVLRHYVERH